MIPCDFPSISSWKLPIIPYLCEIDVRNLPPFGPHKKFIKFESGVITFINCNKMNSSIIWYPLLYRKFYPHIPQKLGHMSYLSVVAPS